MGIFNSPSILMATDTVMASSLDYSDAVETVIIEEKNKIDSEIMNHESFSFDAITPVAYSAPIEDKAMSETTYVALENSIAVAGRVLKIVDVADTSIDSGDHVNKYGDRFLYGHNSTNVFGGLVNSSVGNIFTVSYGGMSKNYQVMKIVIFEKNSSTGRLQLNGSGSYMNSVVKAKNDGVQYDLSLMTCYGTSYGNGDASHRLVIFANSI